MRRRVAIALVLVALVAVPAAVAHGHSALVVGSQHTDFGTGGESAPSTVADLETEGTGTDAALVMPYFDSYDAINDDGDGTADDSRTFVGDGLGDVPISSEVRLSPSQDTHLDAVTVGVTGVIGSDYGLAVDVRLVEEQPDGTYGEGESLTTWDPDWNSVDQTIPLDNVSLEGGQDYALEFVSQSSDQDGARDQLRIDIDTAPYTNGYSTNGTVEDVVADLAYNQNANNPTNARYVSATHDIEDAEEAFANLTLSNAEATVRWEYNDGGSWTVANSATYTTDGNHTLDVTGHADRTQWRANVSVDATAGVSRATLYDEGVRFTDAAPTVDNTTATPTGAISDGDPSYEIQVNDSTFPKAQSDTLTATLVVDGSPVGSDTLNANGTASVSHTISDGGDHSYHWEVTDEYGLSSTSTSNTVTVPGELSIYNEIDHDSLVDGTQVNLTVYARDPVLIQNYSTNDGTVNLTGFPADQPFVVVAEADGYYDRRVFFESLYDNQRMYLLPESEQNTNTIFRISDYTGRFPADDTVLKVQRGINGSWQTVLGDYFGANDQFTAQLAFNTRHRLVLLNAVTGEERVLWTYTPLTSATESLTVSPSGRIDLPEVAPTLSWDPTVRTLPSSSGVNVTASIANGTRNLSSWSVAMYHLDGGNTTLYDQSFTDPEGGSAEAELDLSDKSGTVKVVTTFSIVDGGSAARVTNYTIMQSPSQSFALLDGLAALVGLVPQGDVDLVTTLAAMTMTIVGAAAVGSAFRMTTEGMGLAAIAFVAGFAILGWLPYTLMFTVLVLFAALAFLRRRY